MDINKYGRTILICSFSAVGIAVLCKRTFESVKDVVLNWKVSWEIENEIRDSAEEYEENDEEDTIYMDELYVCKFANATKAEKYANKYGEFVVTLYKIEGFTYVYITEEQLAKKAKFYSGSIVLNREEREKCISLAFKDASMIFEFDKKESAEFFLVKSGIKRFVIWEGYILIDASDISIDKHMELRKLAKECYGNELIDSYTIERVREALSSVTEKGEGLI